MAINLVSSAIIPSAAPWLISALLWHHQEVIALAHIVFWVLANLVGLIALSIRPRRSIEAENLFLRRQLALYKERGIKPRRIDAATRKLMLAT